MTDVNIHSDTVLTIHPNHGKHSHRLNFALHDLKEQIPNVVIKVSNEMKLKKSFRF